MRERKIFSFFSQLTGMKGNLRWAVEMNKQFFKLWNLCALIKRKKLWDKKALAIMKKICSLVFSFCGNKNDLWLRFFVSYVRFVLHYFHLKLWIMRNLESSTAMSFFMELWNVLEKKAPFTHDDSKHSFGNARIKCYN